MVEKVIIPKPPACIRHNITSLPNGEKVAPVSLTIRPVTQVALVAVKRLSTILSRALLSVASGKLKRRLPTTMTQKKLKTISCGGFNLTFFII